MSLDIEAIDYVRKEQKLDHFYNKFDIPQDVRNGKVTDDIWEWLFQASYRTDNELRNSSDDAEKLMLEWRNKQQKKFQTKAYYDSLLKRKYTATQAIADKAMNELPENFEVATFHIGYGGFFMIRKELAKLVHAKYFTIDDGSVFGDSRFQYPSWWENGNRTGKALMDFFLHSDCDGKFSEEQIHLLANYFRNNQIRRKVEKYCNSDWKPEILRFLDFLQRSSKGSIYWDFV